MGFKKQVCFGQKHGAMVCSFPLRGIFYKAPVFENQFDVKKTHVFAL